MKAFSAEILQKIVIEISSIPLSLWIMFQDLNFYWFYIVTRWLTYNSVGRGTREHDPFEKKCSFFNRTSLKRVPLFIAQLLCRSTLTSRISHVFMCKAVTTPKCKHNFVVEGLALKIQYHRTRKVQMNQ